MTNHDELRKLAGAASQGEWTFERYDFGRDRIFSSYGLVAESVGDDAEAEANAEWIAAANPAQVIALLDEIKELREKNFTLSAAASEAQCPSEVHAMEIAQLRAELEQAKKEPTIEQEGRMWDELEQVQNKADAARYRWLKAQPTSVVDEYARAAVGYWDERIDGALLNTRAQGE